MNYINQSIKYLSIATLLVIAISCREVIDFDVPQTSRKIVLNAVLQTDSLLSASVYKSNHVLDNPCQINPLNNCQINVYSNNEFIETLRLVQNGYYTGLKHNIEADREYEYRVESGGLQSVSAITFIPIKTTIEKIDSVGETNYNPFDFVEKRFLYTVTFKDISNQMNFYRIKMESATISSVDTVYYSGDTTNYMLSSYERKLDIVSNDPCFEFESLNSHYYYFTDRLFKDNSYTFSFLVEYYCNFDVMLTASLETISEDFYNYMKTYEMQRETDGLEMFFQAVQVTNNINDGFGILGSTALTTDSILYRGSKYNFFLNP